jgi:hypothetical protein
MPFITSPCRFLPKIQKDINDAGADDENRIYKNEKFTPL